MPTVLTSQRFTGRPSNTRNRVLDSDLKYPWISHKCILNVQICLDDFQTFWTVYSLDFRIVVTGEIQSWPVFCSQHLLLPIDLVANYPVFKISNWPYWICIFRVIIPRKSWLNSEPFFLRAYLDVYPKIRRALALMQNLGLCHLYLGYTLIMGSGQIEFQNQRISPYFVVYIEIVVTSLEFPQRKLHYTRIDAVNQGLFVHSILISTVSAKKKFRMVSAY